MKFSTVVVFIAMSTIAGTTVQAQSKDEAKYRKESEAMRKQVWAWEKPQFNVREVPAQYNNASKVVLAHHTELTADSKSKFQFYVITFGVKKEQTLTEVVREMVKLNDKNAVTEYSELSFTQFQKRSGFYAVDKTTAYVGVRIIKPNGTIKEINADDIILTKDGSNEKQAKVAIPDLQPGDIMDYFIATEQQMTNDLSSKSYQVLLFDDAPILSLSFHGQLGKKYAIDYRSYNGAPELQVGKNDDRDIIIDVEKNNLPPFETSLWVTPGRQLPFIRMNISLGYRGPGRKFFNSKKPGEINKLTSSEEALDNKTSSLNNIYYANYWMKAARVQFNDIESDAKKLSKQQDIKFKELSDDEKAAQLFYTFRYTKLLNFDIDNIAKKIDIGSYKFNNMGINFYCILKAADVESNITMSGTRDWIDLNEAMDASDISTVTNLAGSGKFLHLSNVYDIPFTIPSNLEGITETQNLSFTNKATSAHNDLSTGPKMPISTSDKNAHLENLKITLTSDKGALAVKRSTTMKGYYKYDKQKDLLLYEDYLESERKIFHEEKTLLEDLEDGKKSRKYVDEVKSAFAEARKKQVDAFTSEAKDNFEQEVTNMKDCKTDKLGVRHTDPDFVYSSSFTLGGMVKKAGNNIIVEIGKIQGQPLVVQPEHRKRDLDIHMPFARSIEYQVELAIPDGYSVEGVSALNKKVDNETGYFSAEATATDKLVTITVKKHYLHIFEPVKNWDKLMQFMDAANDWVNTKLLFKKK